MLVLKGSHGSGLGDLIRCLLVAIAYAKISERRLFVDRRGGFYRHPPERNLFDDLFRLVDLDFTSFQPNSGMVYPPKWADALSLILNHSSTEAPAGSIGLSWMESLSTGTGAT